MRKRSDRTSNHGNTSPIAASSSSVSTGDTWPDRLNASASTKMIARPLRMAVGLPW